MTASNATLSPTPAATNLLAMDTFLNKIGLNARPDQGNPPGPSAVSDLALIAVFFRDQLRFFEMLLRTWGDVVLTRMGPDPMVLIQDTKLIEEVLLRQHERFHKDAFTTLLHPLVGHGLLTSEGELWRKQRKIAAPALQKKQIASYADAMVSLTGDACQEWTETGAPGVRDLSKDMMALTLRIVVKTLFGVTMERQVQEVGELVDLLMGHFDREVHTPLVLVPQTVQTPGRRAFHKNVARLDAVLADIIAYRRGAGEGDDLLWRLIMARDEDGQPMSDKQLRDEAITMFLAGHETTSLAITYAWDLLTRNPDALERLIAEVDEVLGGRAGTMEDMSALPWTKAVVQETMRLHPPAWIIGREAIEPVKLGEWTIAPGTQVLMSPWLLHRDARWFEEPLKFTPERWLGGTLEANLPRYAYMPFGGGPRVCIGTHFAMMEAMLIIATMAQHVTIQRVDDAPLRFTTSVTLRPADPVRFEVSAR